MSRTLWKRKEEEKKQQQRHCMQSVYFQKFFFFARVMCFLRLCCYFYKMPSVDDDDDDGDDVGVWYGFVAVCPIFQTKQQGTQEEAKKNGKQPNKQSHVQHREAYKPTRTHLLHIDEFNFSSYGMRMLCK